MGKATHKNVSTSTGKPAPKKSSTSTSHKMGKATPKSISTSTSHTTGKATIYSNDNNIGSALSVDYQNYPYDSHHVRSLGDHTTGTHDPIEDFSKDPSSRDGIRLGYGTCQSDESEKKHMEKMKEQLKAIGIDQKLHLEPEQEQA